MNSDFTSNLNPEEIKSLISQLSADNFSELKAGLEDWLETPNFHEGDSQGLSETSESEEA